MKNYKSLKLNKADLQRIRAREEAGYTTRMAIVNTLAIYTIIVTLGVIAFAVVADNTIETFYGFDKELGIFEYEQGV